MKETDQKEVINILVTIDRKYLKPLINMLDSYEHTHEGILTHVYVAHSALTDEEIECIQGAVNEKFIQVHGIKITDKWFSETPVLERLPEESFYRLMAFEYLPSEVKRCLYLDPDIYIKKSLVSLYHTQMDGYYIAAASHLHGLHNQLNRWRLGLEQQERYINSGVMVMNLENIRAQYSISRKKLRKYLLKMKQQLFTITENINRG